MSNPVSLLPQERTPWELALSLTSANRRPLQASVIRDAINPWTCPEHLLPWLAWSWSIDLWSDAWSTERKRRVIARAARLHRLKGTEAGLREHIRLVDGEVKQVVTPPRRFFASRSLTKDETDDWLRSMPQIRVYLGKEFGSARGLSFVGNFVGHTFAQFDAGRALLGRAARIWDRGTEKPLNLVEITTEREKREAMQVERVSLPGVAGDGAFAGRFAGHSYAGAVIKKAEVVTYRFDTTYNHTSSRLAMSSAAPGFEPVDVRAERISEKGRDKFAAFAKRFAGHSFARPDRAPWLLYDRIVLHDSERAAPLVRGWSFTNVSHIGMAPFTAKAVVDAKVKNPLPGLVAGRSYISNGFARPEDSSRQQAVSLATRVSKSARDRILVTNKLTRPLTLGDRIPMDGSVTFGTRVNFRL